MERIKLNETQHQAMLSEQFLKSVEAFGYSIAFRLDSFSELEASDYIYFALVSEVLENVTLKDIEAALNTMDAIQQTHDMHYPMAVGLIPYEQSAEFLPVFKTLAPKTCACVLPKVILAVHKILQEAVVIRTVRQERVTEAYLNAITFVKGFTPVVAQRDESLTGGGFTGYDLDQNVRLSKNDEAYQKMLTETKQSIIDGEIFQAVISNRFTFEYKAAPYQFYLEAKSQFDMPYNCFLAFPSGEAFAITSPEMLVSYDDTHVRTRPIAGTRPKKNDGRDDLRIADLKGDAKENAEHLMLVDLGRNDLSKVSVPGTVGLSFYKEVKPFHKVYHMVSEVVGKKQFENVFDPIRATFPAGTVSGAPKIRAMEIIEALEGEPRGFYAGATFVIDNRKHFTSCINIRCAAFKGEQLFVQVGSGIVYDSEVEAERKELLNKIRGHLETVERIGGQHVFTHR